MNSAKKKILFIVSFFVSFFCLTCYKVLKNISFMENKMAEDIGEEIIFKLKELNRILEKIFEKINNDKKLSSPYCSRN